MFWADKVVDDISKTAQPGEKLVVRDEKTASGRVHVGSMRGVAIHGIVADALSERGFKAEYLYEINDFDPMDGIPAELPATDWEKYLGFPLCKVPSPDGIAKNFAEYFAKEYIDAIHEAGFTPEFYRASELYLSGKMNEPIRMALEKADIVRNIYKEIYGTDKPTDWFPVQVICENCGKVGTTKVSAFDGEKVSYTVYIGSSHRIVILYV